MPGGNPDNITEALAKHATFSMLIEKHFGVDTRPWTRFILGDNLPTYLIHAHTKFGEANRRSGVKFYESRSLGDRNDYLFGRLVDLDRKLVPDDPFIRFMAQVLLYDFLPNAVVRKFQYREKLVRSLRGIIEE